MDKIKVLIIGASGFIGRALVERLKSKGYDVTGLSSCGQNIAEPFKIDGVFDFLIHLAAYNITHVGDRDLAMYQAINVKGTQHVIDAITAKHLIFMSTAKVYKNEGLVLNEESPINPQGGYAQSKWDAEQICRRYFKGQSLTILRATNVVGEGQAIKAIIPVFFKQARQNVNLHLVPFSHSWLQLLYVEDLIDAVELLIECGGYNGILNLAPTENVRLVDLAKEIIRLTGSMSNIEGVDGQQSLFAEVSALRAQDILNWKSKTPLSKILDQYNVYIQGHHG